MIVCVATTILLMRLLAPVAVQIGLTDKPNSRKAHFSDVPLVGGLSIVIGFFMGLIFFPSPMGEFRLLFFGIVALTILGLLDDHQDVHALWKFLAQLAIAGILVWQGDLAISNLGNIWGAGNQGLGVLGAPLTVLAIVGAINCFNMIDGHDGLAASLSITSLTAVAFLIYRGGIESIALLILVFVVGLTVFLVFNVADSVGKTPKVFLGDAGSMVIGFFVAYFLVRYSGNASPQFLEPVSAIWLIGVPLLDMVSVIVIRLTRRKNILSADRSHIHHILLRKGFSKSFILLAIFVLQVCFCAVGITINIFDMSASFFFWLAVAVLFGYVVSMVIFSRDRGPMRSC